MDGVDGGVMTTPNKKREVAVMGLLKLFMLLIFQKSINLKDNHGK